MNHAHDETRPSPNRQRSREELAEAFNSLSPREREVLNLLLQGFLNKEMAHFLDLSRRTVEDYRASLKRKMGAKTSSELVTLIAAIRPSGTGIEP